jgi:hypothetical protein
VGYVLTGYHCSTTVQFDLFTACECCYTAQVGPDFAQPGICHVDLKVVVVLKPSSTDEWHCGMLRGQLPRQAALLVVELQL